MDTPVQTISLIPYLCRAGKNFCIQISAIDKQEGNLQEEAHSFLPDHSSNPLSSGYRVEHRTSAGSTLYPMTLLIQRDQYFFPQERHLGITNETIDKLWQEKLLAGLNRKTAAGSLLTSEQLDAEGKFVQFSSLFYCLKREQFFHPPCPRCGRHLSLCQDDGLLQEFNLPHYSKSLFRYLYCPTCTPMHGGPWYTKYLEAEDSSVVQNIEQLIQNFGSTQGPIEPDTVFPCNDCPHHGECYGAQPRVLDYIRCFSLYPFFSVLTSETHCTGDLYLAALGGASEEQLATYWQQRGISLKLHPSARSLLFTRSNRLLHAEQNPLHFLEVLYLKLQYLRAVIELWLSYEKQVGRSQRALTPHDTGICIEANSTLPVFWSLAVAQIDSCATLGELLYPKHTQNTNSALTIAHLWFSTLLSNCDQGEQEIFLELHELLQQGRDEALSLRLVSESFQPNQLFWTSKNCQIDTGRYHKIWDRVLKLGYDLLLDGYINAEFSPFEILNRLDHELQLLRFELLPQQTAAITGDNDSLDEELLAVIRDIQTRWRTQESSNLTTDSGQDSLTQADMPATVHDASTPPPAAGIHPDPDRTVIISPEETLLQQPVPNQVNETTAVVSDELEETVIIRPQENGVKANIAEKTDHGWNPGKIAPPSDPIEELEKTLPIVKKKTLVADDPKIRKDSSPDANIQDNSWPADDDDFLTETVVLRPPRKDK